MADSLSPSGRIFISYRRQDTAFPAGWLYDRLVERFGAGQVFKDVDSIELGDDFVNTIEDAVGSCSILLALIGPGWLDVAGPDGTRRLDDPEDFVRLEIEAAISRNVLLIPILVEGAPMPAASELPPSIAPLIRRQALELSASRFGSDTTHLLDVIARSLPGDAARRQGTPTPDDPGHRRHQRPARWKLALVAATAVATVATGTVLLLRESNDGGSTGATNDGSTLNQSTIDPEADGKRFPKGYPKEVTKTHVPPNLRDAITTRRVIAIAPGVWAEFPDGASIEDVISGGVLIGYCASIAAYERKYTPGVAHSNTCS